MLRLAGASGWFTKLRCGPMGRRVRRLLGAPRDDGLESATACA